jgi:hypothetical protein
MVCTFVDANGVSASLDVVDVTVGGRRWSEALAVLRSGLLPKGREVVVSGDVRIGGTMVPALRLLRRDGRSDLILPPSE